MSELAAVSQHLQQPEQRRAIEIPFDVYKRNQAAYARHRLYPLTVFYSVYAALVLVIAFSTRHPWIAVAFFAAGSVTWTLVEYLFHRYGPGRILPYH